MAFMPTGLHRTYGANHLHSITCSCYHRGPKLRSQRSRDRFLSMGHPFSFLKSRATRLKKKLDPPFAKNRAKGQAIPSWEFRLKSCANDYARHSSVPCFT